MPFGMGQLQQLLPCTSYLRVDACEGLRDLEIFAISLAVVDGVRQGPKGSEAEQHPKAGWQAYRCCVREQEGTEGKRERARTYTWPSLPSKALTRTCDIINLPQRTCRTTKRGESLPVRVLKTGTNSNAPTPTPNTSFPRGAKPPAGPSSIGFSSPFTSSANWLMRPMGIRRERTEGNTRSL